MNEYEKAVSLLTSSTKFHIKLGLKNTENFLKILGNPQEKYKIIHIAGTNGKGSVSAMLSEILTNAGYKTGLFTSPHIYNYTERIKINNIDISKKDFAKNISDVCKLANENGVDLTEFETLTCAGFWYFAKNNIEVAVIETGLGGRLDSTNVISKNLCSVITSISFDHTDKLGDTIEKIAYEKSGIIKQDCPIVISESNQGYEIIKNYAVHKNSKIFLSNENVEIDFENGQNFAIIDGRKYQFNLMGVYQKQNLGLVCSVIKILQEKGFTISDEIFAKSLKNVSWRARFQYIKENNLLVDAAHNPDGAKKLRESLDFYFPTQKRTWIYGSLTTKDFAKNMQILFRKDDEIYFYHFDYKNSATIEELQRACPWKTKAISKEQIKEIFAGQNNFKIVCGSFYMLDEVLSEILVS